MLLTRSHLVKLSCSNSELHFCIHSFNWPIGRMERKELLFQRGRSWTNKWCGNSSLPSFLFNFHDISHNDPEQQKSDEYTWRVKICSPFSEKMNLHILLFYSFLLAFATFLDVPTVQPKQKLAKSTNILIEESPWRCNAFYHTHPQGAGFSVCLINKV